MESHLVVGLGVDAFDDVDFAVVGPIRTEHPAGRSQYLLEDWREREVDLQGRPGAANTARHVFQIQNHQSMCVGFGALQANTLTARTTSSVLSVDADIHRVTRGADETTTASSRTVDVANVAVSRVRALSDFRVSIGQTLRINTTMVKHTV